MFPHCFPSEQHYREWVNYAKIVAEPVNICEDCTRGYKSEMILEERCKPSPKWWIGKKVVALESNIDVT
jgi:hypothetical protein